MQQDISTANKVKDTATANKVKDTATANKVKDNNIDRELEFLLKEYEAVRNEILSRETSRTQIATVAIILLGGITAIVPFLLFQGTHSLQLTIPLPYVILMLLFVSLLFTSLQWSYLLHDFEVGHSGNYIQNLRARACQLLNLKKDTAQIFGWELYHTSRLYPSSKYASLSIIMLAISRYAVMTIPALISLIVAGWLYLTHFSLDPVGWVILMFFLFDFLYFFLIFPTARYSQTIYQETIY